MKVITSIGKEYKHILKQLKKEGMELELVDEVQELKELELMISLMPLDVLIINVLLAQGDYGILASIVRKALQKKSKVVVLVAGYRDIEDKKLVTTLVNEGATAFLRLEDANIDSIRALISEYPSSFDYRLLTGEAAADLPDAEERIEIVKEYVNVIRSVFKETIAVYSPLSQGASTIAAHLAMSIARLQGYRVCLVDFNPLKPSLKKLFNQDFNFTLVNVFNAMERDVLSSEKLESFFATVNKQKNLDLLPGFYDLNEYYALCNQDVFTAYIDQLLEKLRFLYDYVILDVHSWHDIHLTNQALIRADRVLVPLQGSRHDVKEVNRYITAFEEYKDFDVRRFKYVINRYGSEDLTFLELEAALKGEIAGYISENKGYRSGNVFDSPKLMREYDTILKSLGFKLSDKRNVNFVERLFSRRKDKNLGSQGLEEAK